MFLMIVNIHQLCIEEHYGGKNKKFDVDYFPLMHYDSPFILLVSVILCKDDKYGKFVDNGTGDRNPGPVGGSR